MIELKRIINNTDPQLQELIDLYIETFPEDERREIEQLHRLIESSPEMHLCAIVSEGETAGLFIYWNFGNFFYLEHLAVHPSMRNRKIGQLLLEHVDKTLPGVRLLEVEPKEDGEMAARRIGFYERNGYHILYKDYIQPSYKDGKDTLSLWIMGNQSTDHLEEKIQIIKEKAYYQPCAE